VDTVGYVFLFLPVISWLAFALWEYWYEAFLTGEQSGQSAWNPVIWPFRLTFFIGIAVLWMQGVAELLKCILFLRGHTELREAD